MLADKTYWSPSSHSIATPRKTTSKNPSKNLSVIQRSDRKLLPLGADTQGWPTRRTRHQVAIPYVCQGKQLLETPVKFERDPTVESKVMALLSLYSSSPD
jgi:hypothetical protein